MTADQPDATLENQPGDNPYRHDHNPLNEDFTGGICSACEWERDLEVHVTEHAIRVLRNALATVGDLLSSSDLAELRAGLVEMTRWVQRNDPASYPEAADRFHHCVNQHEWWGPAFPTCPICHADRKVIMSNGLWCSSSFHDEEESHRRAVIEGIASHFQAVDNRHV